MTPETEALAYPIGKFEMPQEFDARQVDKWIDRMEASPQWYDSAIENLDAEQLETPYRPDGWTLIQVVHHVADSHMNAYIRFKWGMTEDSPVIKPYNEKRWAELPDVFDVPVNVSVTILHAVHRRWVALMRHMKQQDWERSIIHPEHDTQIKLWQLLAMYAWHTKHHFEHIFRLRERMGWL